LIGTLCSAGAMVTVTAEILSRYSYRHRYGIPYRPRIYGDYRYRDFVVKDDGPLDSRLLRGYRSRCVSINRWGLRGPEPLEGRKKLVVIGESEIFGVKLSREDMVWRKVLQNSLDRSRPGRWEVINGGHPGYSSEQHRLLWDGELIESIRPDVVLLRFGGNDLSMAYAMGRRWNRESRWPIKFLWGMNSAQTPLQIAMMHSCLYYQGKGRDFYRRAFGDVLKTFPEEKRNEALAVVMDNHRKILKIAEASGAKVAVLSAAGLEQCLRDGEDKGPLDALNENWRAFSEGYGPTLDICQDLLRDDFCSDAGIPFLDLREHLSRREDLGTLYFDGVHWNDRGHAAVAEYMEKALEDLGWLDLDR